MMIVEIKTSTKSQVTQWIHLMSELWDDADWLSLQAEAKRIMDKTTLTAFVAIEEEKCIGFSNVSLRYDYVEGAQTSPVGYIEGIYVQPIYRQNGIARELFERSMTWAKDNGCVEMASDVEATNVQSSMFHEKLGFQEVNRIICYIKSID